MQALDGGVAQRMQDVLQCSVANLARASINRLQYLSIIIISIIKKYLAKWAVAAEAGWASDS